jgi:hypothetical protein
MTRLFSIALFFLFLTGCSSTPASQEAQARLNLKQIRHIFSIPSQIQMQSFEVYPPNANTRQDKELTLIATFHFSEGQFKKYLQTDEFPQQWQPLPVPRDNLVKIRSIDKYSKVKIPNKVLNGAYFCETAGGEVLDSPLGMPCSQVPRLLDVRFAYIDYDQRMLVAWVISSY